MQRYRIGHRIFDTLLKPRRYHRLGGPRSSGMNLACFLVRKNAGRILKFLVRDIELSEHVETALGLRWVGFDDVRQPFALFLGSFQCDFMRQVEINPVFFLFLIN